MQSDGLEGKAQGRREQAGSEEQARQAVGQEKEAIGLRRYDGCGHYFARWGLYAFYRR